MVRTATLIAPSANVLPIRLPTCSHEEALRRSASAVVDQFFASEQSVKRIRGGSDTAGDLKKEECRLHRRRRRWTKSDANNFNFYTGQGDQT